MRVLRGKCNQAAGGRGAPVPSPSERGVALLVVLGFMVLFTVLAGVFSANVKVEAKLARNSESGSEVEWVCRSGVELAKYTLSQQMAVFWDPQRKQYTDQHLSLNQTWAGGPGPADWVDGGTGSTGNAGVNEAVEYGIFGTLNLTDNTWAPGTVLNLLYPDESPGEDFRCSIKITDMERKFNINRAAEGSVPNITNMGRKPLERTFEMMGVDATLWPYLVDAIFDWRDPGDEVGVNGAESEYYEPLGYMAKNGPIDDLRELLLIKDITPEMYWGNANNSLAAGTAPTTLEEGDESLNYQYALVDLFTPLSVGYVNINTAPAEVLQIFELPGDAAVTAQQIVELRAGEDLIDGTADDEPFESVAQLQSVPGFGNSYALQNAARFFSVISYTFEVRVTASIRGKERTLVAVLQFKTSQPFDHKDIKILYTYWES